MAKRIVVVFTPPHYKNRDGIRTVWFGRINRAIRIANRCKCPIIVAGDANGGKDLEKFYLHARRNLWAARNGARAVVQAFNGDDPALKNTRGDAKAIARVIGEVPALGRAREIVIVSCWYHIPRCWIALRQELGNDEVRISCSPVWSKIWHGIKALPNEIRGCIDYLRKRPQTSRGEPIGKPDFEYFCSCGRVLWTRPSKSIMQENIKQIIEENYNIGSVLAIEQISSGLIHETYCVKSDSGEFIFQKLHKSLASQGIANDFCNVTEHLASRKCLAPKAIKTVSGSILFQCDDCAWRMQSKLYGVTHDRIKSQNIAHEAGGMLARFHEAMHDFQKQFESDFVLHDTQKELDALVRSMKDAWHDLVTQEVSELSNKVLDQASKLLLPSDLPIWVIHGDPKVSNILFVGEKAQAIIDLDTCQRGSVLLDLGDAFRSWCRVGEGEDCIFDTDLFRSAWHGYRAHAHGLSQIEISYVAQAIKLITLELASRFITDYFLDFYFSYDAQKYPSRRSHNLARAKAQWALFEDIQKKQREINVILSLPV